MKEQFTDSGLIYTVIVADTVPPILTSPHFTSIVLCETKVPIKYRGDHIPWSLTRHDIFRYLNLFYTVILVVLIPPKNMFKMFPHISGLENIYFIKS